MSNRKKILFDIVANIFENGCCDQFHIKEHLCALFPSDWEKDIEDTIRNVTRGFHRREIQNIADHIRNTIMNTPDSDHSYLLEAMREAEVRIKKLQRK